jgi:hypothetical protein
MKKPNEFVEVFMSLIKMFLIVLVLNNLIWAVVFMVNSSSDEATLNQDGSQNIQGVNNGTIN